MLCQDSIRRSGQRRQGPARSRGLDRHEPRRARARCIRGERQGERPGELHDGSLRDLLHWGDVQVPFGGLVQGASLAGDFTAENGAMSFPAVQLGLGSDKLDGALSGRFKGGRLSLTGTLAAERLNLADTPFPFGPLQASAGSWSYDPLNLRETGGADLDLRISAAAARLGGLRLDDLAANLLVRRGRVELSLGRATLNRGTVKGRLALAAGQPAHDVKLQGSFDRVDAGRSSPTSASSAGSPAPHRAR